MLKPSLKWVYKTMGEVQLTDDFICNGRSFLAPEEGIPNQIYNTM
jgi:hypothetical protein